MSKAILAVVNDSPDYVNRFLAFLRNSGNLPFDAIGFTSLQALEHHLSSEAIDILLMSENIINIVLNTNYKGKSLTVDSDLFSNVRKIVFMGERQDLTSDPVVLDIYRPMPDLISDILKIYRKLVTLEADTSGYPFDLYGLFILDHTAVDFDLYDYIEHQASIISCANSSVLFIDLDRFSGVQERWNLKQENTLSDLIFAFRSDLSSFDEISDSCIERRNKLDIIAPLAAPDDLNEIPPSQIGEFFKRIAAAGSYSSIIINISDTYNDLISLFSLCREIRLMSSEYECAVNGSTSAQELNCRQYRALSFHRAITRPGCEDLSEKITPLEAAGSFPPPGGGQNVPDNPEPNEDYTGNRKKPKGFHNPKGKKNNEYK